MLDLLQVECQEIEEGTCVVLHNVVLHNVSSGTPQLFAWS